MSWQAGQFQCYVNVQRGRGHVAASFEAVKVTDDVRGTHGPFGNRLASKTRPGVQAEEETEGKIFGKP